MGLDHTSWWKMPKSQNLVLTLPCQHQSVLSKYKSSLSIYKVYFQRTIEVQSNFRNLGNLLNTFGSRNPVPRTGSVQTEPNPSEPSNTETFEPLGHATFWARNLGVRNPVSWTAKPVGTHRNPEQVPPEPGNLSRRTGSQNQFTGFPEPGSFPEPPQLAQNTPKSILRKDPIAFCCWGKRRLSRQSWDISRSLYENTSRIWMFLLKSLISDHSQSQETQFCQLKSARRAAYLFPFNFL